jgi:thioredoxin-dependent peroxiredoxin
MAEHYSLLDLDKFAFSVTGLGKINFSQLSGKNVVLYFYPKDSTPGCTIEGHHFRDHYAAFQQLNTEIFGVSRDSIESHDRFKTKHKFPFELIADNDQTLCEYFDVIKEKSLFGKKYLGIIRSTFLFNTQGELIKAWRKVGIKGHVATVLKTIAALS